SSISAPSLCSALATADSSSLLTICAARLPEKRSSSSACSTGSPRTWSAISLAFCGAMRAKRNFAYVSMSLPLRLAIAQMALESACRGEFAQLVTHHVFRHKYRHVLAPVVDGNGQPDHVGRNHGSTRPG